MPVDAPRQSTPEFSFTTTGLPLMDFRKSAGVRDPSICNISVRFLYIYAIVFLVSLQLLCPALSQERRVHKTARNPVSQSCPAKSLTF